MFVTNVDAFDRRTFEDIAPRSSKVEDIRSSAEYSEYGDLLEDLMVDGFGSLYKYAPRVLEDVPPERILSKRVIEQWQQLPEWQQFRKFTVGDEIVSMGAVDAVYRVFKEMPVEVKRRQRELQDFSDRLTEMLNSDDTDFGSDEFKDAVTDMVEAGNRVDQALDADEDRIRKLCRVALREAADEAEIEGKAMLALGFDDSTGELNGSHKDDRIKIASMLQNNPKLREIVKLAGRFCYVADKKQREKSEYARSQVSGIEFGDDLQRVTPSDMALLSDKDLEELFWLKYIESGLQLYKITGTETLGKGPVVIMVDCSGSMAGQKDIWAKAMALAGYSIARKQNRDFAFLLYNTEVRKQIYLKSGTGKRNMTGLAEILSSGVGGGTDFEVPITYAMREVLTRSEFTKADIIFISDGYYMIGDDWFRDYQTRKDGMEFAFWGIQIGPRLRGMDALDRLSDDVVYLDGDILANQDRAFDMAFTI